MPRGLAPTTDPPTTDPRWASTLAHGLADLLASNRLRGVGSLDPAARDAMLSGIIRRALPGA